MSQAQDYEFLCESAQRLDVCVAQYTGLTRSRVAHLVEQGLVRVQGEPAKKAGYRTRAGERISVTVPAAKTMCALPQDIPLDIVYQDADVAVINKPRGMVVHPAPGNEDETLVNALLYHVKDLSGIGGVLRPGIVHRLDKDTSGLLLVAKNDAAHAALSAQLSDRTMGRVYLALVRGCPKRMQGRVDAPIDRHPKDRKRMAVAPGGRPAITDYAVEQRLRGSSLVRCRLHSGRTHQIRVHMAYIGHPVLGDPLYGPAKPVYPIRGQALHATQIHFLHPSTGQPMEFTVPPPEDFLALQRRLQP